MTQTQSIVGQKLESVQQAIRIEDAKIQELEAVERVLEEVLGSGDAEAEILTEGQGEKAGGEKGRQETLREIVLHALSGGRPATIPEIEAAARTARGKAVRKQGIYSTLHEMVNSREIKRVKPGLYRAVASKN